MNATSNLTIRLNMSKVRTLNQLVSFSYVVLQPLDDDTTNNTPRSMMLI